MGRDDEPGSSPGEWEDVRDEERGMEGGYTSGSDVEARSQVRAGSERRSCAPRGYQRPDERIRDDIYDRLSADTGADASEVSILVEQGEVTLTGAVPDREDERRITLVAERVLGVKSVVSRLRVLAPA